MDTTVITKYRVKKYLKIFSLVLLFALIGLLIYGYVRILPKDIKYSNVSSSSFTVSWTTKTPTKGAVRVIESNNNLPISFNIFEKEIFNDTRDVRISELISAQETAETVWNSNSFGVKVSDFVTERVVTERGTYYTHHIQVKGLDQEKEYSVMVGDGLLFFNSKNFSDAKSVKTTTIPEAMDTPLPAYGQIKDAQNQDIPIDELKPVTDGVVYFNYLDESTQERSNVFSSSLNESGGWYIDIATAVDKDGEYFFEKYSQTITNIYGELLIDLGPLGTWKKVIDMNESSPVETIVINMSNSFEDEGSVKRIDSSNGLVKGVEASTCNFAGWCGPCFDGNKDNSCSCPEATLKARKCDGETEKTMQEVIDSFGECSGGAKEGQYVYYGGVCKQCKGGLWETLKKITCKDPSGKIFSDNSPTEEEEQVSDCTNASVGAKCSTGGRDGTCQNPYSGSSFRVCIPNGGGDGDLDEMIIMNSNRVCEDIDGCMCIYNYRDGGKKEIEVKKGVTCMIDASATEVASDGDNSLEDGEKCREGNIIEGVWKGNKCIERNQTNLLTNKEIEGNFCVQRITNLIATSKEGETYRCINGEFVLQKDLNKDFYTCNEGDSCNSNLYQCISSSGVLLDCNSGRWKIQEGAEKRGAIGVTEITKGEKCLSGECFYKGLYLEEGMFVPQVSSCWVIGKGGFLTGAICNTNGNTCNAETRECDGEVRSSLEITNPFPKREIYAQEETNNEYVIDQASGKVLGIEPGLYTLRDNEDLYVFTIKPEDVENGKGDILVYIDANKNGIDDEGEKTLSDFSSTVTISAVKKIYQYELKEGFNFISLPYIVDQSSARTAAGLLKMINNEYFDVIYSISKYDGKWSVVGQNVELYDNNDFQLVPGQGYIIKANTDITISIVGQPVKFDSDIDNAPITFYPGWNLVGLYGSNAKQYTARSLIQSINKYEPVDFTANNVSRWESDVQRYDGFQLNNENGIDIEYGFDFPINTLQSYFVRILQGKGNWQPELK